MIGSIGKEREERYTEREKVDFHSVAVGNAKTQKSLNCHKRTTVIISDVSKASAFLCHLTLDMRYFISGRQQ